MTQTYFPPSYRYLVEGEEIEDLDEYVPYLCTEAWVYYPVEDCSIGKHILECNVPYYRRFNHYFIKRKETFDEVFHNAILWAPRANPGPNRSEVSGTVRVPGHNW